MRKIMTIMTAKSTSTSLSSLELSNCGARDDYKDYENLHDDAWSCNPTPRYIGPRIWMFWLADSFIYCCLFLKWELNGWRRVYNVQCTSCIVQWIVYNMCNVQWVVHPGFGGKNCQLLLATTLSVNPSFLSHFSKLFTFNWNFSSIILLIDNKFHPVEFFTPQISLDRVWFWLRPKLFDKEPAPT